MTIEKPHLSRDEQSERALNLQRSGSFGEAKAIYLNLLQENPLDFDALYLLGLLEGQENQLALSAHLLCRALCVRPDHGLAHWHLGETFIQMEFYEAAIASFRRARHQDPRFVEACVREGDLLKDAGYPGEALEPYFLAESINPVHAELQFSLGNIFKSAFSLHEAVRHFRKSIIAAPERPDVYINLGNTYKDLNQLEEALNLLRHAQDISPPNQTSQLNQSLIHLLQGNYEEGWALFEARWDVLLEDQKRNFRKPRWSGRETLAGRTIFVYPEQGLGDTLQFCRYLPILCSMGARLIFESPPELRGLMQGLKGAITLVSPGYPIPEFDFHLPLMSLPAALGTRLDTIPAATPYLFPSPERNRYWSNQVNGQSAPKIGLAWSGGNVFRNDRNRSMALDLLAPILDLPFEFHALQKEIRESDREALEQRPNLSFHGDQLTDFSDTAALVDAMDLIVTVDTSVAHLAGALNKPVWILLPFAPDFRWLLDRSDSPWYPSARLFRQEKTMVWDGVVQRVRQAMMDLVMPEYPR